MGDSHRVRIGEVPGREQDPNRQVRRHLVAQPCRVAHLRFRRIGSPAPLGDDSTTAAESLPPSARSRACRSAWISAHGARSGMGILSVQAPSGIIPRVGRHKRLPWLRGADSVAV